MYGPSTGSALRWSRSRRPARCHSAGPPNLNQPFPADTDVAPEPNVAVAGSRGARIRRTVSDEERVASGRRREPMRLAEMTGLGLGLGLGWPPRPPDVPGRNWIAPTATASDGDRGERDAREIRHVGFPPRADDDPLACVFDLIADRVIGPLGQFGRTRAEERVDESIGIAWRGHAGRSSETGVVRASASMLARIAAVAWWRRDLTVPSGIAEPLGHLGQGQAEVVMEDENRSLLDRQPPEGPLELVAVVDGQDVAGVARPVERAGSEDRADQRRRRLAAA